MTDDALRVPVSIEMAQAGVLVLLRYVEPQHLDGLPLDIVAEVYRAMARASSA
jgi:hypothetical protein